MPKNNDTQAIVDEELLLEESYRPAAKNCIKHL